MRKKRNASLNSFNQKKSVSKIMKTNFLIGFLGFFILFLIATFVFIKFKLIPKEIEEVKQTNSAKINSAELSMQSTVAKVDYLTRIFMSDSEVQDFLRQERSILDVNSQNSLKDIVYKTVINTYSGVHSVVLLPQKQLREDDNFHLSWAKSSFFFREDVLYNHWKPKIINSKGSYYIFSDPSESFVYLRATNNITFARIIYDYKNFFDVNGIVLINFEAKRLFEDYRKTISDENGIVLINEKGDVVYSMIDDNDDQKTVSMYKSLILSSLESEDISIQHKESYDRIISWKPCSDTSMVLVAVSKKHMINDLFTPELIIIYVCSIIILLICFFVMSIRINIYINNPVRVLADKMTNIMNNSSSYNENRISDIDVKTSIKEIDILSCSINKMIDEINQYMSYSLEQVRKVEQAELKVLQEQIKPHFLYNTLNAIVAMADVNEDYEVVEAIETLELFYRKFLSNGQETVTVSDEIDIVRNYIKLIKYRYGDLFDEEFEIDSNLEKVEIIKLILQPLVENAIYHGIREKGEYGVIRISITTAGDFVHINVYDTGMGMNDEQIEKLIRGENQKSFGFKGTIDRIRNYYEYYDEGMVSIRSVVGEYCEVDIKIPIDKFMR